MADGGSGQEGDYVIAFKSGNKLAAEQLLHRIPQPAAITTTFEFSSRYPLLALVSLLHLAAYWGWRNVVTALVSVHRVTKQFNNKILHHVEVAVVGGIMQRNVSLLVLAVGGTLIHRY